MMLQNEHGPSFIMVNCSCGRSLRAKAELGGCEVRCWDCHKMVRVPTPRRRRRMARQLSDGALVVIQGPGLKTILVGSAIATALLAIPHIGVWCAAVALMIAGFAHYGESIRRASQESNGPPDADPKSWRSPWLIPQCLVSALMAAGTVLPLWSLNSGLHRSPHWSSTGLAMAAGAWIIGPILMFTLFARSPDGSRLGLWKGAKTLAKHPVATSLALALVPLCLFVAEITITMVIFLAGHLPFYALDFMPMPLLAERNEPPVMYNDIPHYHMIDYRAYPVEMFEKGYLDGIRHGYSFVAAMPASLSMPTSAGMDAEQAIGLMGPSYMIVRLLFIVTIVTSLLAGFAVQAHWLGSIPALDRRKPTPSGPTSGLPGPLNPIGS